MTEQQIIVDFPVLLFDTLGYTHDEFVSVGHDADGEFCTAVMAPRLAPAFVAQLPTTANIYFGVNPTRGPARTRAGRGTEAAMTRLSALWADLDFKTGGCGDLDTTHAVIGDLTAALATRPSVIVNSGHGLHPYWPVADGHIRNGDFGPVRALARRWGRLVAAVAAQHGAEVDSVFDLARMLRVPGTTNNKAVKQ